MGIAKSCIHLHPAPSTSTQLHLPAPSSFQLPPSYLQHPQRYKNQNIARNWAISANLDRKIQSCPFYLKIGACKILEVLIPNPALDFRNSNLKIPFWANLGRKSQGCPFCLKIATHGILEELIPNLELDFRNPNSKMTIIITIITIMKNNRDLFGIN